jgi:hypothetical protein
MTHRPFDLSRRAARLVRFLAVVVALAGQISGGAAATSGETAVPGRAALDAATVLCLGGTPPARKGIPPVHHHPGDHAIAAARAPLVQPAAIPAAAPVIPPPAPARILRTASAAPRAPPPRCAAASRPRAPPIPT